MAHGFDGAYQHMSSYCWPLAPRRLINVNVKHSSTIHIHIKQIDSRYYAMPIVFACQLEVCFVALSQSVPTSPLHMT